jgi:hypothetical protein
LAIVAHTSGSIVVQAGSKFAFQLTWQRTKPSTKLSDAKKLTRAGQAGPAAGAALSIAGRFSRGRHDLDQARPRRMR